MNDSARDPGASKLRAASFGQRHEPTWVDRFGVWLSAQQMRRFVPSVTGLDVADLGCGYQASFARTLLSRAGSVTLIDVALADDLKQHPKVRAFEGELSQTLLTLADRSLDLVLIISVLEHLRQPLPVLEQIRRLLRPGGTCLVNVPSWRGRRYLEFSAFKLGLSPSAEMDDHKAYYDVRDLWPLLVQAGFLPSEIECFSHKFGLNTFAACRLKQSGAK
ncbi:MAG: methyltransferase domain-containing protein [Pseudomonadota bacterium]